MVQLIGATYTAATLTSSITPTIPTHQSGDRLGVVVEGKYNTATIPSAPAGWSRIGSAGGGTGSAGNDTGTVFGASYWRDATASGTTMTVNAGATQPNSWGAWAFVFRLDAGESWTDSAVSSMVQYFASDTNTASPLTGTTSTPSPAIDSYDAILAVGVIPTDTGTAMTAGATITCTGLSGGTVTNATTQYGENNLGTDCAQMYVLWTGFTGTSSAGVAVSMTATSATDHSGLILVIPLRVTPSAVSYDKTPGDSVGITDSIVADLDTASTAPTKWCTVDGVPNGTSVTIASTATGSGDPLESNGSGSGTCVSTTSGKIRGTAAMQFDGTGVAVWREMWCQNTETSFSARVYFRVNSGLSIVTNSVAFMGIRNESDGGVAQAVLSTSKALTVQNSAGSTVLNAGVLSDGDYVLWIGVVIGTTTSNGTIRTRLRNASNDAIVAEANLVGTTNTGTEPVKILRLGKPSSSGNLTALILDEPAILEGNATEIDRVPPGYTITINDTVGITDTSLDQELIIEDSYNESVGITDQITVELVRNVLIEDSIGVTDDPVTDLVVPGVTIVYGVLGI